MENSNINIYEYIKEIPLYQHLYGGKLNELDLSKNINDFPILERKNLAGSFPFSWMTEHLQSAIEKDEVEYTTTSGTSGERLQIVRRKGWWQEEYKRSYKHNKHLSKFNLDIDKKAVLTTAICSNTTCHSKSQNVQDRMIRNTLYLNYSPDPNRWQEKDIARIIFEINNFEPGFIDANPIYLGIFLKKCLQYFPSDKIKLPKFISLDYELTTSYALRFINSQLDIPIVNLYGTTEVGCLFHEMNNKFYECPDLIKFEYLPFCSEKNIYYLIVTSLKNEFMPFIRFKVGDLIKLDAIQEKFSIHSICGRAKEITYASDGEPVTVGEIEYALSGLQNDILIYQLECFKSKKILFNYVTTNDMPLLSNEMEDIKSTLIVLYGNNTEIEFAHKQEIYPEASGKFAIAKMYS